jgi:hypothetical protein
MVNARIVRAVHGEQFSLVSPRWCTCIFVVGDLLCLNVQSTEVGFLPKPKMKVAQLYRHYRLGTTDPHICGLHVVLSFVSQRVPRASCRYEANGGSSVETNGLDTLRHERCYIHTVHLSAG